MSSIRFVALRNLTRRSRQSCLVVSVLALSSMLFLCGVGLLREIHGPFEAMFERLKGAQVTLVFDSRVHDIEQIREWWLHEAEAVAVGQAMPMVQVNKSCYLNEQRLSKPLLVTERPMRNADLDHLRAIEGSTETAPGPGEVWIPTSFLQEVHVRIGDILELPTPDGMTRLEVTAIVIDPQFSAPFNSPIRVWVAPDELPNHFPLASLNHVLVAIRLSNTADLPALGDSFQASIGGNFNGDYIDYQRVSAGYTAPYQLVAVMLLVFSLLSIMVALLTLHGTVSSSIVSDLKFIGLLRAQGFRPVDVRRMYQLQYLLLAVPALLIGNCAGVLAVRQGISLLMKPTGIVADTRPLGLLAAMVSIAFAGLIYFFVGRVARRADRVRPVDAIRFAIAPAMRRRGKRSSWAPNVKTLSRLSVSLIVAIKMLDLQRTRAVLSSICIAFATLTATFAINLDCSFVNSRSDLGTLGFDSADVRLVRGGKRLRIRHETFVKDIMERDEVLAVSTLDYLNATLVRGGGRSNLKLLGTVLAGDPYSLGLRNEQGRNPSGEGEISIGITTARRENIEVGQRLELLVFGRKIEATVTGIFQSLNNGGTGFRIPLQVVQKSNPLYEPVQYGLALVPGVDAEHFMESIEAEFGEAVDAQPGDFSIGSILDGIIRSMRISNTFLSVVLLAASCTFIFNSTLMSIAEGRRTYGILKSVGMSPAELHWCVLWNLTIQAALGIIAALSIWWFAGGAGLSLMFASLGLVSFPLHNDLLWTFAVAAMVFAFCVCSGWLSAYRQLRFDPKGLILE